MHATCCPECFHTMYLPDESYFGLKGKCPECGHKFELYPLASEITDVQEPPPGHSSLPEPVKAPSGDAYSSEASAWPPAFENSRDADSPARDDDEESVNFDAWEGDEETFGGANPFQLEQVESRRSIPLPEEFDEEDAEAEFSVNRVWDAAEEKPAASLAPPTALRRLPAGEQPPLDPRLTWTSKFHPPPAQNGSARPEEPRTDDWGGRSSVGPIVVRCPYCESRVDGPANEESSRVTCSHCGETFHLVNPAREAKTSARLEAAGHFRWIEPAGRGAMGTVYKAYDIELDRIVAVKIPHKELFTAEEREEFFREASAGKTLRHPNIAGVYEVGREDEGIVIVRDFVEGVDLARWLKEKKPSCLQAVALCAKLAAALHHAHALGMIHLGLKPANIMLDGKGEPRIMDFGFAQRECAFVTRTVHGDVLGTPAYMAPELIQGDLHAADARADVYSLGAILFELLTGERPFRGKGPMVQKQILEDEAQSPRKFHGAVSRDLETICLRCLEKHPAQRFPSALALQEELERVLRNEPILSRPVGRMKRALRWCRRSALTVTLIVTIALLLVLASIASTYFVIQSQGSALEKRPEVSAATLAPSAF